MEEQVQTEAPKSKSKGIVKLIVVLLILAVTAFIVWRIKASNADGQTAAGGKPGGWGNNAGQLTAVRTVEAVPVTLKDYVITNGEVETQRSIEVFPSVLSAAKLVQLNVSLGSPVKAGDIIAYVDPSEAGASYKLSPVVAPISGSIISSPVKVGAKVTSGSVIAKIGDIDNLQVTAKVPERFVADLSIGLKAEITLQPYPDTIFTATVVRVAPVLDAATRTKDVILNFDKPDSRVNAGMYAKVKLFTVDYPDTIVIQQDAVVNNADRYYLYTVKDDNTASKKEVTLGKNIDGKYQILSGIESGETVIVEGMLTLYEGAKVNDITKPKEEKPADGE